MPLDSRAIQTTATNSATYLVNKRRRVFATGASGAAGCGAFALTCCPAYSLLTSGSFAAIEYPPNGCNQTIKLDRFGVELLAPCGNRLLALARQRMCRQSDDGNVLRLRVVFQTPRGFPAVNNGHFEVHQDNVRLLGRRHLAPFLAVLGRENLEIPKQLKPHFEHIDVVVVVFDVKHFDHEVAPSRCGLPACSAIYHCFTGADRHTRFAKLKLDWASLRASATQTRVPRAFRRPSGGEEKKSPQRSFGCAQV